MSAAVKPETLVQFPGRGRHLPSCSVCTCCWRPQLVPTTQYEVKKGTYFHEVSGTLARSEVGDRSRHLHRQALQRQRVRRGCPSPWCACCWRPQLVPTAQYEAKKGTYFHEVRGPCCVPVLCLCQCTNRPPGRDSEPLRAGSESLLRPTSPGMVFSASSQRQSARGVVHIVCAAGAR